MKWIGQLIYDQIAKFRNDVYLESISTGTIASGGNLGLDSNNKIVKAAESSGGISYDGSTANGVLTFKDSDEATVESNLTFDGSTLTLTGDITANGDTFTFQSANADDPQFIIKNTTADNQGARLQLRKDRGAAMADGDRIGEIDFFGEDASQNTQQYGKIIVQTVETDHGSETGKMDFKVAQYDGTVSTGLILTGQDADDEIDVEIGKGAASTTTIAGTLTMGSTAAMNHEGVVSVAAQTNITSLGTLTALDVDNINLNDKTITITGDTSDTFTVVTGAAGATTMTTTDAGGAAGHFEIAADGDIILDAAGTIKLEGPTRSTGQIHMTHHNFNDDIDTTKHYVGLGRGDSENTATNQIQLPLIFPTAAKLLEIHLRANQNLSAKTLTFTLETQAAGVTFGTGPTIVGTQSGAGCTNSSIVKYDFTTGLDSGDNIIDAGDAAFIGIESDSSTSTTKFYITCVWEVDFSSI